MHDFQVEGGHKVFRVGAPKCNPVYIVLCDVDIIENDGLFINYFTFKINHIPRQVHIHCQYKVQ